mmetsp:Transcript_55362/g.101589  ORF Transcript_55362/g.101589 Transcript_55362/m.101589 type:complete len:421 (-) Transcript_55362:130-1392(-)
MMEANPETMIAKLLGRYSQVDDQHPSFQFSSGATSVNPFLGPGFRDIGAGVEDSMASFKTRPDAPQPNEVPTCSFMAFGTEPALVEGLQVEMTNSMASHLPAHLGLEHGLFTRMTKGPRRPQGLASETELRGNGEMERMTYSQLPVPAKASPMPVPQMSAVARAIQPPAAPDFSQLGAWQSSEIQRSSMFLPQRSAPAAARPVGQQCRPPQRGCRSDRGPPPGLAAESLDMWPQSVQSDIQMQFNNNEDYEESNDEDEAECWRPAMQVQLFKDQQHTGPKTTLMVRNIPVMYTQEMLLMEWPNNNTYDFLYLPYSCSMQRNLTYAFINFTSTAAACEFKKKWQKTRLAHYMARKPLNISFADLQGRDDNLLQLKKKRFWRIKIKQCQPIIFENGERISLAQALHNLEATDAHGFGSRAEF